MLIKGECLEEMDKLIEQGVIVDSIIADIPYGTTACKWDTIIPFPEMWERLNKLIKPNGAIVLFGSEPFSSALRMSNIKNYKYDWIWEKNKGSNFASVKFQPMKVHETISIFNKHNYYPIKEEYSEAGKSRNNYKRQGGKINEITGMIRTSQEKYPEEKKRNPRSVFKINTEHGFHPTQKPVALMEYLIKTYTQEGETVLDFTAGSFSTIIGCDNTNRKWIGIEMSEDYCKIGKERIIKNREKNKLDLLDFTSNI